MFETKRPKCEEWRCKNDADLLVRTRGSKRQEHQVCSSHYIIAVERGEPITLRVGGGIVRGYAAGQIVAV